MWCRYTQLIYNTQSRVVVAGTLDRLTVLPGRCTTNKKHQHPDHSLVALHTSVALTTAGRGFFWLAHEVLLGSVPGCADRDRQTGLALDVSFEWNTVRRLLFCWCFHSRRSPIVERTTGYLRRPNLTFLWFSAVFKQKLKTYFFGLACSWDRGALWLFCSFALYKYSLCMYVCLYVLFTIDVKKRLKWNKRKTRQEWKKRYCKRGIKNGYQ